MSLKVIKPLLLGFLWRTYKRQGNHLAITGLLSFPFASPEVPLTEQEMWQKIGPLLPSDTAWDEGIPKERGELLLLGDCHAPRGVPTSQRRVTVRVGPVAKSLDVFGNRFWINQRGILEKSFPEPFLSMPLDYAHSFGGAGYGPNPTGIGFAEPTDGSPRPVPNIEDPLHPLTSFEDPPEPAGLGPLGLMWSQRKSRTGSYRPDELSGNAPPPLPENTDWTLYNQAPVDQWLSGYWNGGEAFILEGFHPEEERQEGRLPRILLRSVVFFKDGGTVDVPLRPETVWLFPGLSMGVIIHRGVLPIESDDASEIGSILLGSEDPEDHRSVDHYCAVKARRDGRDSKDFSRFGDAPLLPVRLADDPRANLLDVKVILEKMEPIENQKTKDIVSGRLDEVQKKIEKARENLKALPDSSPGSLNDLKLQQLERLTRQEEQLQKVREELSKPPQKITVETLEDLQNKALKPEEIHQKVEQSVRAAVDKIPQNLIDRTGKTREELVTINLRVQAPPKGAMRPGIDPGRLAASLRTVQDHLVGGVPAGQPPSPKVSGLHEKINGLIASLSEASEKLSESSTSEKSSGIIRILQHFAPPTTNPDRASALRRQVMAELSKGRTLSDRDLRGADLSGLDLSEKDFSGADLIGADFSGSNLNGAKFVGAWVTYGNFSKTMLNKTDFSKSNLGCSDFTGVRGDGATFERAILTGAVFTDCDLSGCSFVESEVFQIFFKRSRFHRGQFGKTKFLRVGTLPYPHPAGHSEASGPEARIPFEACDFSESDFSQVIFMKIDFNACDLSKCLLDQASLLECNGPGSRFDGASLKKTAFPKSGDFRRSSFRAADMTGANLRELDLSGSDFRGAILSKMDGSGGTFRQANLSGVTAIQSLFQKADLTSADARGGDFRQALFLKADLRGTDFSYGSLYRAGFAGAKIDGTTLWNQALTAKANISRDGSP